MVVDEFFDPFVIAEDEEEAAAASEAESPSQQPLALPARPSLPVPGPSGWTPSSAPAKVSSVHIPATGRVPTRPRNPAPPRRTPLMKAARRIAKPQTLPRLTPDQRHRQIGRARRRTLRPTFEELAALASDYDRSTEVLSQGLAERYSLTAPERH